jgi:hypothetical protein
MGPRAGWTKFSDSEKLAIINRHLVADGKRPISRATYYRWKAAAKAAGLLAFESTAYRRRDRKRFRGGRWMAVTEVPAVSRGRFPRRFPQLRKPENETFLAPVPHRDNPPQRDHAAEKAPSLVGTEPEPKRGDREARRARASIVSPPFSAEIQQATKELTQLGAVLASQSGQPWRIEPARESMRRHAVRRALTLASRRELELRVVGTAWLRARAIDAARAEGVAHDFWEGPDPGDIVAKACSYVWDPDLAHIGATVREIACRTLRSHYGIDPSAPGYEGLSVTREEPVWRGIDDTGGDFFRRGETA